MPERPVCDRCVPERPVWERCEPERCAERLPCPAALPAADFRLALLRVVEVLRPVPFLAVEPRELELLRAAAALPRDVVALRPRPVDLRAEPVLRPPPLRAVDLLLALLRADAVLCAAGLRAEALFVVAFRFAVLRLPGPDREPDFVFRAIGVHSPVEQESYSKPSI